MSDIHRLASGFLVTLTGTARINFPLLTGAARVGNPARLAVIEALSLGYEGQLDQLVAEVSARFETDADGLRVVVDALLSGGFIRPGPSPTTIAPTSPTTPAVARPADDIVLRLPVPISLTAVAGGFESRDHAGELTVVLTREEVVATAAFGRPITTEKATRRYRNRNAPGTLDETAYRELLDRLLGAGILRETAVGDDQPAQPFTDSQAIVQAAVDARVQAYDEARDPDANRTEVVPVNTDHAVAPTALALLVAHAMTFDDGRLLERYDFVPAFLTDEARVTERAVDSGIYLFSNYVWNVDDNLRLSAAVKAANPSNITIHGGPSTPKYDVDAEAWFAEHPHVDISVRGEGENTFTAILDALGPAGTTLDALASVEGLTYRTTGGVHRTDDRERIADLDTIPSPYLMGLLDDFGSAGAGIIIETNRGCPYGCTFCDWGSATLSRIRKFSLERVFAELDWCAEREIDIAAIADANYGIFERDVEISQKIAELKRETGFPRTVATNYAKNTVKHLRHIIEIFADVEILTEGVVSLQSMDEPTLKIIKRSNIKLEKYNELATEFRRAKLPLAADIMMGLPGSTPDSFRSDLQKCTDRDVRIRANPTQLLPNSPMNEPSYREEHGIVAEPGEFVMESASFTRAEWDDMNQLRAAYYIFDNWGVLRFVARYVRSVTEMGEVDFYDLVRTTTLADPDRWPTIATTLQVLESFMAPPGSWGVFVDEVREFVTQVVGLADDSALRTTLAVQHAHLPAPDRAFPEILELEHDFAAWQDQVLTLREDGHRDDWEQHAAQLADFGPATMEIHDPNGICQIDVGKPMAALAFALRSWELESPAARPRLGATTAS